MGLLDFINKKKPKQEKPVAQNNSNPNLIPIDQNSNSNFRTVNQQGAAPQNSFSSHPLTPLPMNNTYGGMVNQMPQARNLPVDNTLTAVPEQITPVAPVNVPPVQPPAPVAPQPVANNVPPNFNQYKPLEIEPQPVTVTTTTMPMPDLAQSHDPNSMQNELVKADPMNAFQAASLAPQPAPIQPSTQQVEETIYGEGQLSDIYSQKFPDPTNIIPKTGPIELTTPTQASTPADLPTPVAPPVQTYDIPNLNLTSNTQTDDTTVKQVDNLMDEPVTVAIPPVEEVKEPVNVSSMSDLSSNTQQNLGEAPETSSTITSMGDLSNSTANNSTTTNTESTTPKFDMADMDFKMPDFNNILGGNLGTATPPVSPVEPAQPAAWDVNSSETRPIQPVEETPAEIPPAVQAEVTEIKSELPEVTELPPIMPVIAEDSTSAEVTPAATDDLSIKDEPVSAAEEVHEETPVTPEVTILNSSEADMPKLQEKIFEAPVIEELKTLPTNTKKIFRKIALIGLNGPTTNLTMANDVSSLVSDLLKNKIEVTIDSEVGLGQYAVHAAKTANTKLTSVLLKPVLSTVDLNGNDGTTQESGFVIIYSNFVEWMKHMLKEPRLFVVFDGGGLLNQTLLMNILSISGLYSGHHKPIVLVGSSWNNKLESLKTAGIIDADDISNVIVLPDTKGVIDEIDKLNAKYSSTDSIKLAKVVDRRVEGDEKDYMVY